MTSGKCIYNKDNLRLRQFVIEDTDFIVQLNRDARVTECLLEGKLLSSKFLAQYFVNDVISRYQDDEGLGSWIAERREASGEWSVQGWFNLSVVPDDVLIDGDQKQTKEPHNMVELGSRLARVAWGSRLSTQLGQALLDRAFNKLQLPRVLIHCAPDNRSAIYCSAYLGFEHPKYVNYFGKDTLQYQLSAERFKQWGQIPLKEKRSRALSAAKTKFTAESPDTKTNSPQLAEENAG